MESQELQGRILLIRKLGGLDGENEKGKRGRELGGRWEMERARERGEQLRDGGDERREDTIRNKREGWRLKYCKGIGVMGE
jgi:hypothetical protein